MRVLAVDFGTSNTVAMLSLPDGRTRPLLFDGSPLLPSAVYLDPDGRILVGRDAERSARLDPARFEPNPKRRVDDGALLLGGSELPVARVIGAVLAHVLTEARRQLGAAPEQVRLTHPERWGDARRQVLLDAARQAGLGNVRIVAEPVAAASYYTAVLGSALPVGRALAIYDLGGGTFDAAVVRRIPTGFEVLSETGIPDLGGLDFDHAIVEHLGRAQSDNPQWTRLVHPGDANDRRYRRMLYDDVRGAKEMLSRTASADIHLPTLGTDAHLTRDELETMVRPDLERTVTCLQETIGQARMAPTHLVGIFLVGGSSRIPLAAHLIHSTLGIAPTTLEQPETVVVEGSLCLGAPMAAAPVPARGGQPAAPHPVSPGRMPPRPVSPVGGRPVSPPPQPVSPHGPPRGPAPGSGAYPPPVGPVSPGGPGAPRPTSGPPARPTSAPPGATPVPTAPGAVRPTSGPPNPAGGVPPEPVHGPAAGGQPMSAPPGARPVQGPAAGGRPMSAPPGAVPSGPFQSSAAGGRPVPAPPGPASAPPGAVPPGPVQSPVAGGRPVPAPPPPVQGPAAGRPPVSGPPGPVPPGPVQGPVVAGGRPMSAPPGPAQAPVSGGLPPGLAVAPGGYGVVPSQPVSGPPHAPMRPASGPPPPNVAPGPAGPGGPPVAGPPVQAPQSPVPAPQPVPQRPATPAPQPAAPWQRPATPVPAAPWYHEPGRIVVAVLVVLVVAAFGVLLAIVV